MKAVSRGADAITNDARRAPMRCFFLSALQGGEEGTHAEGVGRRGGWQRHCGREREWHDGCAKTPHMWNAFYGAHCANASPNGNFDDSIRSADESQTSPAPNSSSLLSWMAVSMLFTRWRMSAALRSWRNTVIESYASGTARCSTTSTAYWRRSGESLRSPHLPPTPPPQRGRGELDRGYRGWP